MRNTHLSRIAGIALLSVVSPVNIIATQTVEHLTPWPAARSRLVDCKYVMRIDVGLVPGKPEAEPAARVTQHVWYQNMTGQSMPTLPMIGPSPRSITNEDGTALAISKPDEQGVWKVQLDRPLPPNGRVELSMQFDAPFRVSAHYPFQEYRELAGAWHPKVVDMEASGPLEGANGAIASYNANVIVPNGWRCVTSGLKRSEKLGDGKNTLQFAVDHVADFTVVLTNELESVKREAAGVSIELLHKPERKPQAEQMADLAADVVEFYNQRFGFYPQPYLCIVMLGRGFGGGPVGGNIVRVNDSIDRSVPGTAWGVAHEIGHEYWGFECVVDSDHVPKWFGLGMGLHFDKVYCNSKGWQRHSGYNDDYVQAVSMGRDTMLVPIPPRPIDNEIKHAKGFLTIELLHHFLGENRFNRAVQSFLTAHRYRRIRQDVIQTVFQKYAPHDLSTFFDDWLRTNKSLDYGIKEVSSREVEGKFQIDVELESIGELRLPVPIEVPIEVRLTGGRRIRKRWSLPSKHVRFHADQDWYYAMIDPDRSVPDTDRDNNVAFNPDAPPALEISEIDLSDIAWGRNVLKFKVKNTSDVEEKLWVWIIAEFKSCRFTFTRGIDTIVLAPGEERWVEHMYWVFPTAGRLTGRIEFVMPSGRARPHVQEAFLVKKYSVTFDTANTRCNELTPLPRDIRRRPELYGKYINGTRIPAFAHFETQHFVFYCSPGTPAHADMPKIKADREKALSEICDFLGVQVKEKILCFFYPDASDKSACQVHVSDRFALATTVGIGEIYNEKTRLDPYHKLTHVAALRIGNPPALLREGLATYMSERLGAPPLENLGGGEASLYERVRELRRKGDWIPLEELPTYTEIGSEKSRPRVACAEAGAFVKFLIDSYGKEKFLKAYKSLRNSSDKAVHQQNQEKLERIYGKSLRALSQEWQAAMAPSNPGETKIEQKTLAEEQEERHQQAAAEIEKLGGVVAVNTSESGDKYTEVKLLGREFYREWKGGTQGLKHLGGLVNLRSLRIMRVEEFTDEAMVYLRGLTSLQSLSLSRTKVTDDGLVHLKNLTNLQYLALYSNRFTDGALQHIKGMTNLEVLRLDGTQITDEGVKKLKESGLLTALECLTLGSTRISDAGLVHLKDAVNLEWLDIRDTEVTDAGLAHLQGLPKLRYLILTNTGVSDAGLVHLKGLTRLRGLQLDNTRLTDAGLKCLAEFANLFELMISGTQVTDAGLAHLKRLSELKVLDLSDSGITDAGLEHLKGLTRLNSLWLWRNEVTFDGYTDLEQALPECKILWTPRPQPPVKVGDPAPELSIDRLLQAPGGAVASWESLKGKVVVLEFWATWCGPCVAAVPHMNDLAEKLKDKPIQFMAVTSEKQPVVEQFLKKHQIKGWVGVDPDRSMDTSYSVRAIPRTVVVDKAGIIRAITRPTSINKQALDKLLGGEN